MCCFDLLNCYIYEASKKWRNRQMKREQVLALYDAYADSVYRVALGYLRSPHDAEDAVQYHNESVFLRQLHHGTVESAILRLCRQNQIV